MNDTKLQLTDVTNHAAIGHPKSSMPEPTPEAVRSYLKSNPQFLETYVLSKSVTKENFLRWCNKKLNQTNARRRTPDAKTHANNSTVNTRKSNTAAAFLEAADLRKHLLELAVDGNNADAKNQLLHQLLLSAAKLIAADEAFLFLSDRDTEELYCYSRSGAESKQPLPDRKFKPDKGSSTIAVVSKTLKIIRSPDITKDERFADGCAKYSDAAKWGPVITCPLLDGTNSLQGVMEFGRLKTRAPFDDSDEKTLSILTLWGCHGIYFGQLFQAMNKQRKLNDFLLTVTRTIFQDMVSMDSVIMKIMNFAQKLVNADRASLFLVDNKTNELFARIFDVGTEGFEAQQLDSFGHKEIRFPMDRGIAGHVASTGQILNIEDAYSDDRFNREVDLKTGYTTKTILCMPIYIRGLIIGVVQMVNKLNGVFDHQDEEAFETFAVYCGLALHHAKLYDKIRRSEQKYRVALEVLAYHSVCSKDEFQKLIKHNLPPRIPELESYDFNALAMNETQKPMYAVYMFKELFGLNGLEYDDLVRFVLTVRKNYRRVPYHNWTHGWSVAHAMFVILRNSEDFTGLERISMFVASLCHDLDHRGKNNAFMKNFGTPLAAIYSTSVMEHHHFNQCVTILQILQHDGHNIFKNLSSEDYKWVLGNIKHCILSTDLALFFPNKAKLRKLLDDKSFDRTNTEHRLILQAVSMTGCDLIASAKPWNVQTDTVKVIFEEFYEQGDTERANGREPIPMMDRTKAHELPQMQVGFLSGICIPCYELLSCVLQCCECLVEKCKFNKTKWQELADEEAAKHGSDKK